MNDRNLRELLEQLHNELQRTESLDEKGRELLTRLSADIQKIMGEQEKALSPLQERLQNAIDEFELEHPAITTALSQVLNALSNAGI